MSQLKTMLSFPHGYVPIFTFMTILKFAHLWHFYDYD